MRAHSYFKYTDGTYSFIADNGEYVYYKSSTSELVVAGDTIVNESTSKFTVDTNGPGMIILQASNGKYLAATETGDPDNWPIMATGTKHIVPSSRFVVAQVMITQGKYNRV